jgi:hypothetical protein
MADYLVHCLPGAAVRKVGELDYRKRVPLTKTERNRRSIFKQDLEQGFESGGVVRAGEIGVTLHDTVRDTQANQFRVGSFSVLGLKNFLERAAKVPQDSKESQPLFLLTTFRPPVGEASVRAQQNIHAIYGLVLDFDGGSLSPETFVRLIWDDGKSHRSLSFLIFNTFSRSEADPNRFRVIFPFKRATDLEGLRAVYEAIEQRLKEDGYPREATKLDPRYLSGIQSSYLPCTNRAHPKSAFFESYGLDRTRNFVEYGIDPEKYRKTRPTESVGFQTEVEGADDFSDGGSHLQEHHRKRAEECENTLRGMTSGRHTLFYQLAVHLALSGLSEGEVKWRLSSVAGSELKMRLKIRGAIASLHRYGHL